MVVCMTEKLITKWKIVLFTVHEWWRIYQLLYCLKTKEKVDITGDEERQIPSPICENRFSGQRVYFSLVKVSSKKLFWLPLKK